jgi:hypothetical protein
MDGKDTKVMQRLVDEAWNKKNPGILDELLNSGFPPLHARLREAAR